MRFDRSIYFDCVRVRPFGGTLTQDQVDGQESLLSNIELAENELPGDLRHYAYMLATTFHETAATMMPITEYGSASYLKGKPYYPYIGRGYVQLTWEENYRRASEELERDLVAFPDQALEPLIAWEIMSVGMAEGWFTGHKLEDYFNETVDDPVNARRIVNGNDKDTLIAGYHADFLAALNAAQVSEPVVPGTDTVDVAITTQGRVTVSVSLNGETILVAGG